MIYESNNGALEANAEATPVIVESNTGSSDANVVANPVVEGEIQGGVSTSKAVKCLPLLKPTREKLILRDRLYPLDKAIEQT
ncbi:hypothetical protein YC2023_084621 [Brassica napus]